MTGSERFVSQCVDQENRKGQLASNVEIAEKTAPSEADLSKNVSGRDFLCKFDLSSKRRKPAYRFSGLNQSHCKSLGSATGKETVDIPPPAPWITLRCTRSKSSTDDNAHMLETASPGFIISLLQAVHGHFSLCPASFFMQNLTSHYVL